MLGGSLGGMMTTVMGGLEPALKAVVPIVAGGGLGDIGIRSKQGGVREAFVCRPFGPIYTGTLGEDGGLKLEMIIPDLNNTPPELHFATIPGVASGDTLLADNLGNGARACGYVATDGTVRVQLESDAGDPIVLTHYAGHALKPGDTHCGLAEGATVKATVDTFEYDVTYQGGLTKAGTALVALAEGLGLRRANPELRRFQGLGQLVLDPADPAVYAQHMMRVPLVYPATGEEVRTHVLQLTSIGDMGVPVASGMTISRAIGTLDFLDGDTPWGVPANQVLLDHHVAEGVTITKRFTDAGGSGILVDIDDFSEGTDRWSVMAPPRATTPLRAGLGQTDPLGGESATLFMYPTPYGQHGPNTPGRTQDVMREACEDACQEEDCGCDTLEPTWEDGHFFFHMGALYLVDEGARVRTDTCMGTDTCPEFAPIPPARPNPDLAP